MKGLLEKAKSALHEPDIIIDLYTLEIKWTNEIFAKNLGYTKAEILKKRLTDILKVTPIDLCAAIAKALEKHVTDEKNLIRKDGKEQPVKGDAKYFTFHHTPYFVGKITEWKKS